MIVKPTASGLQDFGISELILLSDRVTITAGLASQAQVDAPFTFREDTANSTLFTR